MGQSTVTVLADGFHAASLLTTSPDATEAVSSMHEVPPSYLTQLLWVAYADPEMAIDRPTKPMSFFIVMSPLSDLGSVGREGGFGPDDGVAVEGAAVARHRARVSEAGDALVGQRRRPEGIAET